MGIDPRFIDTGGHEGRNSVSGRLPIRPLALGFAVNTLAYAAACFGLYAAAHRFRTIRRRRNNLLRTLRLRARRPTDLP